MVFNIAVLTTIADFALTPWTGGYLGSAAIAGRVRSSPGREPADTTKAD
jgi:hypothetical protein